MSTIPTPPMNFASPPLKSGVELKASKQNLDEEKVKKFLKDLQDWALNPNDSDYIKFINVLVLMVNFKELIKTNDWFNQNF